MVENTKPGDLSKGVLGGGFGSAVAAIADLNLAPPTMPLAEIDWVESKQRGWNGELKEAMEEKDSLQVASIKVLTKRNEQANQRIQQLEELVNKKDERIERLVDIIIKKLGGFDGG